MHVHDIVHVHVPHLLWLWNGVLEVVKDNVVDKEEQLVGILHPRVGLLGQGVVHQLCRGGRVGRTMT